MKQITFWLLLLGFTPPGWCGKIVYPWRATTSIVKAGDTFEVWFDADPGQVVHSVTLRERYHFVSASLSVETGRWEYDPVSKNAYEAKLKVTVPRTVPAGRYDVELNTSSGIVVSQAGVKVIKNYKPSYYILHLSDIHAFQRGYEATLPRLSTLIDIANIINPEIVFNTGDNLYRPTDDRMTTLFEGDGKLGTKGLNSLNAAVFVAAGNHDTDFDTLPARGFYKEKADWWNKWWGLQAHSFTYADGRFMVINNGWEGFDPAEQIAAAGSWLQRTGAGNFRVAVAHIRNRDMAAFDSTADLGLVLIGHNHHIASQNPSLLNNKPIQYIANSVREHLEFNLFKVDVRTGKYTRVGGPTAQVLYVENPEDAEAPHLYKPKLSLSFAHANDGSCLTNTARIVNKFDFSIEGARVRFVVPQGSSWSVHGGAVEQSFYGSSVQIVDVLVDLKPYSTNLVELKSRK